MSALYKLTNCRRVRYVIPCSQHYCMYAPNGNEKEGESERKTDGERERAIDWMCLFCEEEKCVFFFIPHRYSLLLEVYWNCSKLHLVCVICKCTQFFLCFTFYVNHNILLTNAKTLNIFSKCFLFLLALDEMLAPNMWHAHKTLVNTRGGDLHNRNLSHWKWFLKRKYIYDFITFYPNYDTNRNIFPTLTAKNTNSNEKSESIVFIKRSEPWHNGERFTFSHFIACNVWAQNDIWCLFIACNIHDLRYYDFDYDDVYYHPVHKLSHITSTWINLITDALCYTLL